MVKLQGFLIRIGIKGNLCSSPNFHGRGLVEEEQQTSPKKLLDKNLIYVLPYFRKGYFRKGVKRLFYGT